MLDLAEQTHYLPVIKGSRWIRAAEWSGKHKIVALRINDAVRDHIYSYLPRVKGQALNGYEEDVDYADGKENVSETRQL